MLARLALFTRLDIRTIDVSPCLSYLRKCAIDHQRSRLLQHVCCPFVCTLLFSKKSIKFKNILLFRQALPATVLSVLHHDLYHSAWANLPAVDFHCPIVATA